LAVVLLEIVQFAVVHLEVDLEPLSTLFLENITQRNAKTIGTLSLRIQAEFVGLLGRHVKEGILKQIHDANYFAVMLHSTPDISRVD